jgi:FkbM family methyltransferase
MDILNKYSNSVIFAYDPTPKSINWVKNQNLPNNFNFFPYGISNKTEESIMYMPKNKNRSSGSLFLTDQKSKDDKKMVKMKCLEEIIQENGHKYIDILKMDIEGSEFTVIENINFSGIKFGQIVIEFHARFFNNGKQLLKKTIKILKRNGYYCFAKSNGNEYSFINKSVIKNRHFAIKKEQGNSHIWLGIFLQNGTIIGNIHLHDIDKKSRTAYIGMKFSKLEYRIWKRNSRSIIGKNNGKRDKRGSFICC